MPTPLAKNRRYKWWVVVMLWFICFLNYGDRQAINSIFPKLHDEFGFDEVQLGLIGSAFMWVYAFAAPLAGYVGDRARRKDLILGGCLFWSFVTITTSWCGKLWQFVGVRALEGLGETFYFPASMSLVSDYHDRTTRSKALSFHQSSVYAGTIAGSWLAAWLAERSGWRSGFYVFGGTGMLLAIVLYAFLREPRRGQSEAVKSAPEQAMPVGKIARLVFGKPTVLLLMAAFIGANFVATVFLTWTPTYLSEKFNFKLALAGLSGTAFINVASAFGSPLGGILADRFSRRFIGGRILIQAAGLLLGAPFIVAIGLTPRVSTLLVALTLFGLFKGLYDSNIFASVYDAVPPAARSTLAGVMNTVGWGGGALGPLVVGVFMKYGHYGSKVANMSHAIAWTGAVYIVAAALLIVAATVFARRDCIPSSG